VKIISVGDDKYLLRGTMKMSSVEKEGVEVWKKRWNADNVLRNGDEFYFCNKVLTAEFTDI